LSDAQPSPAPQADVDASIAKKINLGCGEDYREGWHNVDIRPEVEPDAVADLDRMPWPLPDDHAKLVLVDNVLEHLDDQLAAMHELKRITEPGGCLVIRGPHWNSPGQAIDPTHTTPVDPRTFRHDVAPKWEVLHESWSRVRLGRLLPEQTAAWVADHVGHVVDSWEVEIRVPRDK